MITVLDPGLSAYIALGISILLLICSGFVSASEIAFFFFFFSDISDIEEL